MVEFRRSVVRPNGRHVSVVRRAGVRGATASLVLVGTASLTAVVATNPAEATGTARYVAQGGNDTSNDCTSPTNPCATISRAVSQSNSGDTINVSGTIDDHVTIGTSLTITQWSGQPQAVVDGTNSGTPFTINSGTVTLQLLTIENGTDSSGEGGGIFSDGTLTVNSSTLSGNTSSVYGGGIFSDGTLTVNNSTLSGNTASFGGGIVNEGTVTVNSSTLSGNTGTTGSGGIQNIGAFTVNRSTLSGNTAPVGGGILNQGSSLIVNSSTLSGNTATSRGGGVWSQVSGTSFDSTIVAANSGGNCDGFATPTSLGYNLTDDSSGTACNFTQPTDLVNANPNLGGLANNGGPTQTMLPPPGSPAIEAIPNPTTLSGGFQVCPRTDQRGVSSSPGAKCTIGAVEVPSIRYVAHGGSDNSNDCSSPATPCATISHAVSVVGQTSGDTIYVSGTIDDHITIGVVFTITLTIRQWPNQSPAVVDGTNSGQDFTISSGNITLSGLKITNGSVNSVGGGIYNDDTLTLNNATVSGNSATSNGGGIDNDGALTLNNSTVSGNSATGDGGGINNTGGTLAVNNSTISGNHATGSSSGGGIFNNSGHVTVNGSTVAGNTATLGDAGGIASGGTLSINTSTVSGNAAHSAGAIENSTSSSTLSIVASTISANTASTGPGGIFNFGAATLGATIVAANGENCASGAFPAAFTSLGYNLTDDSIGTPCGFTATGDVVDVSPNLGALANNGGPTQTMLPPNPSPEAFVIPNPTTLGTTPVCPRTDQRGVASSGNCTIGAVEALPGVAPSLPSGQSHTWTTGQSSIFTINANGTPTPTITYPYGQPGSGKLPNGLTLSTSPGSATISGTPAPNAGGTYNIKLIASNGVSPSSTQTVAVVVQQAPVMSLPKDGGTVGFKAGVASSVPWSVTAPATTWPHITQPVTYATNGIPMALNFTNNGNGTGTISGTLAKGTYGPMSIKASNVAGSSTTTFTIKAQ